MSTGRRLAAFGLAVGLLHHLGSLGGLGDAGGGTRWQDWLDLVTPLLVVGTAWWTLAGVAPDPHTVRLAAAGGLLYTSGHGIHLAANSIGNARGPAAPVHLWDEVVGHGLWYAGLAVLVLALSRSVEPTSVPPAGWLLAAAVGLTWTTNALGADGLVLPMTVVAAAFAVLGWRARRTRAGRLMLFTYGLAALMLPTFAVLAEVSRAGPRG